MRLLFKVLRIRRDKPTLKAQILKRLATEVYTCKLPKVDKPRIRYKLRRYKMVIAGKVETVWS